MHRSRLVLALAVTFLAAPAAAAESPSWPQRFERDGNEMLVYQPQLDAWTNRVAFAGRVAVIVTPKGGSGIGGVLHITARTETDPHHYTVALDDIAVAETQFPNAPAAEAAAATALAKTLLPTHGVVLLLDHLLASLVQTGESAASVQLDTTPPRVFLAEQPARLLLFDGSPSFALVPETTVEHAINTNWPLLRATDAPGYYLLDSSGWLTSQSLESGAWSYATQLPASFSTLPKTPEWQDVTAHIPPPPSEGQPPLQIYVSTLPAELIVIVGKPQYARVAGTGLFSVENTDSLVFWDGYAKAYYYLVAGRWFRAPALAGPWTHVTGNLPADFSTIPPDGPLAAVLASVPNTIEAREAALAAQVPRLATVSRKDTHATATFAGPPQFAPIDGTSLSYAVNTPDDVIRAGDRYYLCKNGVWFVSDSPDGPWTVATSVPDQIYAIPPSSPLYNVTYVRLYQVTDDSVVSGYTDGYLGEYVADGVVTWGTGYYYPPYLAAGAVPYYYPRPYTYGCDAFYDPRTASFHRGGYGYGPYGGIAAGAVYVPSTGAYARGVAVYGPQESGAAVQAYNPRTGTTVSGTVHSNPYATWDQGVVYGPQRSARGAAYENQRGGVAGVETSGGGKAVAVTDGERSAVAVQEPGGDWYAGGDGHLYARTDDGWQRYGDTAPRQAEVVRDDVGRDALPGLGRPVDAGGYVPSHPAPPSRYVPSGPVVPSRYVPSTGWNAGLAGGLDRDYAARQRSYGLTRRYANWGGRGFGRIGGGRYGGVARGGGRRR